MQNRQNSQEPGITGLQLDSQGLGDISNSVNLFRGDVNLPLQLVTLTGHNGLQVEVKAFYGSNVHQIVNVWNMYANTGILGVGWSMQFDKITIDRQNTATSYDDQFYLVMDGVTVPLYRMEGKAEYLDNVKYTAIAFQTREYQFWKIIYYSNPERPWLEKWELVKDNGVTYVFGLGGTQWGVEWDNWVGSTIDPTGRTIPMGWNVVEIKNLWGESVHFTYDNYNVPIGDSHSAQYTQASRIHTITDPNGQTATFFYSEKNAFENQWPIVGPADNANAFQFQFEDKFLDYIEVKNEKGKLNFSTHFAYEFYNLSNDPQNDNYKKRYLSGVTQKNRVGEFLPGVTFDYCHKQTDINPGAIQQITFPYGGTAVYSYESEKLTNTSTQAVLKSPGRDYIPKVWYGPDYVVVSWYNPSLNEVCLNVYTWGGCWQSWEGTISGKFNMDDFCVITSQDFFTAYFKDLNENSYKVWLFKENPYQFGQWQATEIQLDNRFTTLEITVGKDFVALQTPDVPQLIIEQWNGLKKTWDESRLAVNCYQQIALTGNHNFCLAAYYDDARTELIYQLYYADENRIWQRGGKKVFNVKIDWTITQSGTFWTLGDSFAAATYIKEVNDSTAFYDVSILQWREDFTFVTTELFSYEQDKEIKNPVMYTVIRDNILANGQHLFRFDGQLWKHTDAVIPVKSREYQYTYGADLTVTVEKDGTKEYYSSFAFNPYQQQWEEGTIHFQGSAIQEITIPSISGQYCIVSNQVYYKDASLNWNNIYTLPDKTNLQTVQNNAPYYLAYQLNNENTTYVVFLKDGKVTGHVVSLVNEKVYVPRATAGKILAGANAFITYKDDSFDEVSELYLYRVINESLDKEQVDYSVACLTIDTGYNKVDTFYKYDRATATYDPNGKVAQFVTARIYKGADDIGEGYMEYTYFNGLSPDVVNYPATDQYTNVKDYYSLFNGKLYQSVCYNSAGRRDGCTTNYYYACDQTESGDGLYGIYTRLSKKVETAYLLLFDLASMYAQELNDKLFSESLRAVFVAQGFVVSATAVVSIKNPDQIWLITDRETNKEYTVTKEQSVLEVYGIVDSVVESSYNSKGQIATALTYNTNSVGQDEVLIKETVYGWQVYPDMAAVNLLMPTVVGMNKSINETKTVITGITVNTFKKDWGSGPNCWASHKDYTWDGTAGTDNFDFAQWSGDGEPDCGWIKTSEIIAVVANGLPREVSNIERIHQSILYDKDSQFKVAEFSNGSLIANELSYYGFESYENQEPWFMAGTPQALSDYLQTEDVYTGSQALLLPAGGQGKIGLQAVLGPQIANQTYVLACWVKTRNDLVYEQASAGWDITLAGNSGEKTIFVPVNATKGTWKYFHHVIDPQTMGIGSLNTITLFVCNQQRDAELLIDHIVFTPFLGAEQFSATVYDTFKQPIAGIDAVGGVVRTAYDYLLRPVVQVGVDEMPKMLFAEYLWRQYSDTFNSGQPNSTLAITVKTGGLFDDFQKGDEWRKNWQVSAGWTVKDRQMTYTGGQLGTMQLQKTTLKNFGVRFKIDPTNITQAIGINIGDVITVQWVNGQWQLYDQQQKKMIDTFNQPIMDTKDWLLISGEHGVMFFANGRQVLQGIFAQEVTGGLTIFTADKIALDYLVVFTTPMTTLSYNDNTKQVIQTQQLADTAIAVNAVCYDQLGREAIVTKTAGFNEMFGYRESFVESIAWSTGVMQGEISRLYPSAEGYPYSRTRFEKSPLSRNVESGIPGKLYAICHEDELSHTTLTDFSANTYNALLPDLPAGQYLIQNTLDPDKTLVKKINDRAGKTIASIEGRPEAGDGHFAITRNYYNDQGQLIKIMLPNAFQQTVPESEKFIVLMDYDFLGRMTKKETPDTDGAFLYCYDRTGRIRFTQDPNGGQGNYMTYRMYDILGRVTEEGCCDYIWNEAELLQHANDQTWLPEVGIWSKKYSYDGDGTDANSIGKLVKVQVNNSGVKRQVDVEESFSYDKQGNISSKNITVLAFDSGAEHISRYEYDNLGNIAVITYNGEDGSPFSVHYSCDVTGKVNLIESRQGDSTPVALAAFAYNSDGSLQSETFNPAISTALTRTFSYNVAGWPTEIKDRYFTESLEYQDRDKDSSAYYSGKIAKTAYQFSNISNTGGLITNYAYKYTYDELGRLQKAQNSASCDFDMQFDPYDANGNLSKLGKGSGVDNYTYYQGTDKLQNTTGDSGEGYKYNPNGSVCFCQSYGISQITYDRVNQMAMTIQKEAGATAASFNFQYDGGQQRVLKQGPDSTTLYLLDFAGKPLLEITKTVSGEQEKVFYIYGPTGMFAIQKQGKTYNLLSDHLHSTRAVYDGSGICAAYNYLPFGGFLGSFFEEEKTGRVSAYLFTGQELDGAIGLYNFKARFYDSSIGRFYSADPAGQFPSPYIYGGNDPIYYIDPTGKFSWAAFGAILGGIVLVIAGAALTIATAGAAAPLAIGGIMVSATAGAVIGGAAVGAGISSAVYGATHTTGNFKAGEWGAMLGLGAAFGAISGGIGCKIAGAIVPGIITDIGLGATGSYISNGVTNVLAGHDFNAGAGAAAGFGALFGLVSGVLGRWSAIKNSGVLRNGDSGGTLTVGSTESGFFGHSVSGVKSNGNTTYYDLVFTEQGQLNLSKFIRGGQSTKFRVNEKFLGQMQQGVKKARGFSLNISTDRAFNAAGFANSQVGNKGGFNVITNSCVAWTRKVVGAAGLEAPVWARTPTAMEVWFKSLGAVQ